jgi:S1-C subfamily serine protease
MHLPRLRSLALRAALSVLVSALTPLVFAQSPAEVFQRAGHSVGIVLVGNMDGKLISAGSAVAVDPRLMVTNFHVVTDRASRIYVFLNSRRYEATVFRCEKEQDLCLIDVQGLDVPPVELGNADDLKVGDTTFAIGGPQ